MRSSLNWRKLRLSFGVVRVWAAGAERLIPDDYRLFLVSGGHLGKGLLLLFNPEDGIVAESSVASRGLEDFSGTTALDV